MFRRKLKNGELDDTVIELEIQDQTNPFQGMELPGMQPGQGPAGFDLGASLSSGPRRCSSIGILPLPL